MTNQTFQEYLTKSELKIGYLRMLGQIYDLGWYVGLSIPQIVIVMIIFVPMSFSSKIFLLSFCDVGVMFFWLSLFKLWLGWFD